MILLSKQFGCCRFVYNYLLDRCKEAYEEKGIQLSWQDCCNALPQLKKDNPWLLEVDAVALQQTARDLDAAFTSFYSHRTAFPVYHSKKNRRMSYRTGLYKGLGNITNNTIWLPKLKAVRIVLHRQIPVDCKILNVVVSKTASSKYYVSIVTQREVEIKKQKVTNDFALGLDYSSADFYVDSQGMKADTRHYYKQAESKISWLQRLLSKTQKGSKNHEKIRHRLARAEEKVVNQKVNWLHNLALRLANSYSFIAIEDINLEKLKLHDKNFILGKSVQDNGFGLFRRLLNYKLEEQGKKLVKIDKYFPSSQLCSCCGYRNYSLQISDRIWTCPQCGQTHDRDHNAAKNILAEGLRLVSCT